MNILLINLILYTVEERKIKRRKSIKDCLICNFANGFIENGHKVTIVALEDFKPLEDEDLPFDIIYLKSWLPSVFKPDRLPYPKGLRKFLRKNISNYDMIISGETFSMPSVLAADICKEKLYIWQEMSFHQKTLRKLVSKTWHNVIVPLFLRNTKIVARSEEAQRFISQYSKNVVEEIVRNGANSHHLFPDDISEDYFIVVSRLDERKNVKVTVDQFAKFIKVPNFEHYKLKIIGYGVLEDDLKQQVKSLGIDKSVHFMGRKTHQELAVHLRHAKGLLINTVEDLNLLTIAEAIISGTPVISNTVPDGMKYINNNHMGIARDGWDETDLIEVATNYESYHQACVKHRDEMTNVGCAQIMTRIHHKYHK
ncbi:MAG: glycosyltransferase [Muribaculaceae bacterium]|nr:glycosyltransferase [Muribaculaceae bacterium]